MSWCDLDLTLDLAVVTLTYNILSGLCLSNSKVQEVDTWWCGFDLAFGLALCLLQASMMLFLSNMLFSYLLMFCVMAKFQSYSSTAS